MYFQLTSSAVALLLYLPSMPFCVFLTAIHHVLVIVPRETFYRRQAGATIHPADSNGFSYVLSRQWFAHNSSLCLFPCTCGLCLVPLVPCAPSLRCSLFDNLSWAQPALNAVERVEGFDIRYSSLISCLPPAFLCHCCFTWNIFSKKTLFSFVKLQNFQ